MGQISHYGLKRAIILHYGPKPKGKTHSFVDYNQHTFPNKKEVLYNKRQSKEFKQLQASKNPANSTPTLQTTNQQRILLR